MDILYDDGIHAAALGMGFMGKSKVRNNLYTLLRRYGYMLPALIDPSATVADDVVIGAGTYIGRRAVVNAEARIGHACIINSGSIVEHECVIGDFSHIAVGTVLCGQVHIGSECMIGANSTIIQGLSVGNRSIIGVGTVVAKEVEPYVLMRDELIVRKTYLQ